MSLSNTLAGDHMTCDTPQSDRAKLWRRSTGRGGEHWRRYPETIFLARAKLWRRNTDEAMKIVDPATFFLARAKLWRRSTDVGPESSVSKSVSSWKSVWAGPALKKASGLKFTVRRD